MATIGEWIKSTENFKAPKKGWKPHASPEKGTDTVAYGHKLSQAEHDGNYVVLPDGSIHDFDIDGNLSDVDANLIFEADLAKAGNVVAKQWDAQNLGIPFASLDDKYKAVLVDIGFQTGGLNNKNRKFGWPKLAKAIVADDVEEAIAQSTTTFKVDGVTKQDNRRNRIKKKVLEGADVIEIPQSTPTTASAPVSGDLPASDNVSVPQNTSSQEFSDEEQAYIAQRVAERREDTAGLEFALSKEDAVGATGGNFTEEEKAYIAKRVAARNAEVNPNTRANRVAGRTVEGKAGREERINDMQEQELEDARLDDLF